MRVWYEVKSCGSPLLVTCIKSVHVEFSKDGDTTHVIVYSDFSATVNGDTEDITSAVFIGNVYVKKITSLFVMIRGFGFKVLYAPCGRIYAVFDPYFLNKVRCFLVTCKY